MTRLAPGRRRVRCDPAARFPAARRARARAAAGFASRSAPGALAWLARAAPGAGVGAGVGGPEPLAGGADFGVVVYHNALTAAAEAALLREIDAAPWEPSQSGRRKQDYGAFVNFKKRKIKMGIFDGLPPWAGRVLVPAMRGFEKPPAEGTAALAPGRCSAPSPISDLAGFTPVELCVLEYEPARGAAIAPHFDDAWLWGERLVTFNLLAPALLSFCPPASAVPAPVPVAPAMAPAPAAPARALAVPLDRRSLVVVFGPARHAWRHAVARDLFPARRLAATLREFGSGFAAAADSCDCAAGRGACRSVACEIRRVALGFRGKPTVKPGKMPLAPQPPKGAKAANGAQAAIGALSADGAPPAQELAACCP